MYLFGIFKILVLLINRNIGYLGYDLVWCASLLNSEAPLFKKEFQCQIC
jgi:hypothetical protein